MDNSPFTLDRFEHERVHLYHLPEDIFSQLKLIKPIYLIGSRGTGKTTLLNSLNWKERLYNENLKFALNEDLFESGLIGIYLKISNSYISSLDGWIPSKKEELKKIITGLYIDLLWLEELFIALANLTNEGCLNISIKDENIITTEIFELFFKLSSPIISIQPNSFISLSSIISELHQKMARSAINDSDPEKIIDLFPIEPLGSIGRKIAKKICKLCDESSPRDDGYWHIKVSFDESEVLSKFQKTLINSMIRMSESEVFFVVSYATEIDELYDTNIPNLSTGRADRVIIELNEMSDKNFREFVEGVSLRRINARLGNTLTEFNLTKLLGKLNINKLLEIELNNCENKNISNYWFKKAEELESTPFYKDQIKAEKDNYPLYQAYLFEKRKIPIPSPSDESWKIRKQESAEIRKRMVAAFLCLCNDINHKVPYAYDKMVLQMSDNCIRDYLLLMHYIFIETKKPLKKFIKIKNLNTKTQTDGLREASWQKMATISESSITSPREVVKLVDGLAKLTSSIQKNAGSKSLASNEKGQFVLNTSEQTVFEKDYILDLIHQAYEGGYLRMLKGEEKRWRFQIHTSLAPAYELSYRGAQYELRISMFDLFELTNSTDEEHHKKVVESLLYKYNANDPEAKSQQGELFSGM